MYLQRACFGVQNRHEVSSGNLGEGETRFAEEQRQRVMFEVDLEEDVGFSQKDRGKAESSRQGESSKWLPRRHKPFIKEMLIVDARKGGFGEMVFSIDFLGIF